MVPSQAIVPSPRGQGVYLIENGKAKLQPVEIGIRTDDQVQILRGVKEGDVVATTNLLRIRPGLEVTAVEPRHESIGNQHPPAGARDRDVADHRVVRRHRVSISSACASIRRWIRRSSRSRRPTPAPIRMWSPRRSPSRWSRSSTASPASARSPPSRARNAAPSPSSSPSIRISTPPRTTCATGWRARPAACRWIRIRRWWRRPTRIPRRSCSSRMESDQRSILEVSDIADRVVRERMETIPGVSSVRIFGEKRYAMRLWMDPVKLAVHGLTPGRRAGRAGHPERRSARAAGSKARPTSLSLRTLGRLVHARGFRQPHHQAGKRPPDPFQRHRPCRTRPREPAHRLQERAPLSDRRGGHPATQHQRHRHRRRVPQTPRTGEKGSAAGCHGRGRL